jgi:predicted RNA-binding Zn-ribbon protein involved in translation (DUF1610 family)
MNDEIEKRVEEISVLSYELSKKCKEVLNLLSEKKLETIDVLDDEDIIVESTGYNTDSDDIEVSIGSEEMGKKTVEKVKTYLVYVECKNCRECGHIRIPFGKSVRSFSRSDGCPECGVDDLFPYEND